MDTVYLPDPGLLHPDGGVVASTMTHHRDNPGYLFKVVREMTELFPTGWGHYLAGGLLLGCGVALLFLLTGLVGGMSTVYSSTWSFLSRLPFFQQTEYVDSRIWRLAYAAGLVIGAFIWWRTLGPATRLSVSIPAWKLFVGGVLVGYGARLARGCTSGHGICGLASLERPSLVAVLTFMTTAVATANMMSWMADS